MKGSPHFLFLLRVVSYTSRVALGILLIGSSNVALGEQGVALFSERAYPSRKVEAFLDNKKASVVKVETEKGADKPAKEVVVAGKGKEKTVVDSAKLLKVPPELPVTARLSTTSSTKAETDSLKPQSVDKWETVKDDVSNKADAEKVTQAIANVERLAEPHIEGESRTQARNDTALKDAYDKAGVELSNAYATVLARNNHADRNRLAATYGRVVNEKKSIYGYNDNYDPEVYDAIFKRSRSCVGLVHPGRQNGKPHDAWQPNVSGILIAPNLVLTCSHDITDETLPGEAIEVWFGYERDLNGTPRPKTITHVTRLVFDGRDTRGAAEPLDFALFEIAPIANQPSPLPLTTQRVTIGTSIYVVGYPKGEFEAVHDNTHVIFPFEVTEKDYSNLKIGVHSHLIGETDDSAQLTDDLFAQSYERAVVDQRVIYRYYQRLGGEHMPVMGADCDTFHGDSGGGAFLRNSSRCCGILIEGDSDRRTFTLASFLHHEKILPLRVINERLADKTLGLQGWPSSYNVSIEGPGIATHGTPNETVASNNN